MHRMVAIVVRMQIPAMPKAIIAPRIPKRARHIQSKMLRCLRPVPRHRENNQEGHEIVRDEQTQRGRVPESAEHGKPVSGFGCARIGTGPELEERRRQVLVGQEAGCGETDEVVGRVLRELVQSEADEALHVWISRRVAEVEVVGEMGAAVIGEVAEHAVAVEALEVVMETHCGEQVVVRCLVDEIFEGAEPGGYDEGCACVGYATCCELSVVEASYACVLRSRVGEKQSR